MSRIYVVVDTKAVAGDGQQPVFLVDADSQAQAIGLVVGDRYGAKAATSGDVAQLMEIGVKVIKAKALPEIEPAAV